MLPFLNFLRGDNLDLLTITVRIALAVLCGSTVGLERGRKRRPAGFRTHILICLGACMTTLTSQYVVLELKMFTDLARLGAQVIAGIGFIGAGTIIVTKNRQVKGLTTAAGLWTTAIVGLCLGAGFYEGAIITTAVIIIAELLLSKIEYAVISKSKSINILVEYTDSSKLANIVDSLKKNNVYIMDMEVSKSREKKQSICAIFSVRLPRRTPYRILIEHISNIEGVLSVEEL
ncbi:MAG: MgtC/SapB family protein [Ruminococcaceae bacterium]|nr:MgtC/SapB family protein [Oscillospiraceae bacterium]